MAAPLVSLAMMVKNEEDFLGEALESVRPWVDELVVVDTGSTDRTIEIARDAGARVEHFEWCDSFSAARNATLKAATGDWVLILDADERVRGEDPDAFRRMLTPGPQHPFEALLIDVVNVTAAGQPLSSGFGPRVFPRDPRLGYSGRVHNRFRSLDPEHPTVDARYCEAFEIIHLGYDAEVYRQRMKSERSLPLIEAAIGDDPDDLPMRYYLGRELMRLGRFEDARLCLVETVGRMSKRGEQENLLQAAYHELIDATRLAGRPAQETMTVATEALGRFGDNADLWFAAGGALIECGQPAKALECLNLAAQHVDRTWSDLDRSRSLALHRWDLDERLGLAHADLGQLEDAYGAFERALSRRPPESVGVVGVLEALIGIGGVIRDEATVDGHIAQLVSRKEAPLDAVFHEAARRAEAGESASALALLDRFERVRSHPQHLAARAAAE